MYNILTFRVDGKLYGVETRHVGEIYRNPDIVSIPLMHSKFSGVMNLRGKIVTILDLSKIFDITFAEDKRQIIVIKNKQAEEDVYAFLIEQVEDVLDVGMDLCEDPNMILESKNSDLIMSIAKLEDEALAILDVSKIMNMMR